jgi:hypothetical protein
VCVVVVVVVGGGTYPLLAGDGAVPDHEVHRPVGHCLRLRDETLRISRTRSRHESAGPGPGPGWEAKREGMRRYGHGGGSCAKPCAPPRGGRARSLLPTWAAAGEVALLLSADQIRFRSLRRWWDDDELVLSFLSLEKSNLVRKFLLAPELHQKFHFYV